MALSNQQERGIQATASLSITELYAEGRDSATDREEWPHAQIVERLDGRTCELCGAVDGMVLEVGSPEYSEWRGPSHINCRRVMALISKDEPDVTPDFERPSQTLIERHGHYHINPRAHAELRMPAEPAGRHIIARRIRNLETGRTRMALDWAPWWDGVPQSTKELVLRARYTEDAAELGGLLERLGLTNLDDPEQLRRACLLGLRDRVEGWVDEGLAAHRVLSEKELEQRLRDLEEGIALQAVEHALVVDETGQVLVHATGTEDAVSMTPAELATVRGNHVTHNHPDWRQYPAGSPLRDGGTLSLDDLMLAAQRGALQVRAVSKKWRHVATPPTQGWNALWAKYSLAPTYDRAKQRVILELRAAVLRGELTEHEALSQLQHLILERVSSITGMGYSRTPRKP
ncbi:MAG TPA: hypothetical protein VGN26_12465 [Armatimonadota bacterium]